MKEELYKKVYIHSEDDLPKEEDNYWCMPVDPLTSFREVIFNKDNFYWWTEHIDWYLQPIPDQDLPKTTNKPNLKELEKRIDNVLANETPESLNLFLFYQRCDLTDEELLKFPKEEILQLYKNCYEMLLKYTKADQDSRENLRKALSDAFEAGRDFQMGEYSEYHGGHESETPDKKEWIDEYLKHKE